MKTSAKPPGFFYQKLSAKEKAVYNAIYSGVIQRQLRFRTSTVDVDIGKVIDAISDDCPEIYWISEWNLVYTDREIWFKNQLPYLYSAEMCRGFEKSLVTIAEQFQVYDNDFEKELAVHNYLITHVKFDHSEVDGRKPTQIQNHNIIGPLIYGVGVCEGIAKACQYLLQQLGVTSILVKGESWSFSGDKPIGHAWNIVRINDLFYHLDTSHDLCLSEKTRVPHYHYFNLTEKDILYDHNFSISAYSGVSCHSHVDNYYKKYNMYFENETQLLVALKKAMNTPLLPRGYKRITFKVAQHFPKDDEIFRLINCYLNNYRYTLSASIAELQRVYSITIKFCE